MTERLVIVGNGMAPGRMLEHLFEEAPGRYEVTIFNAEPRVNYDRIMLSPVLSGEKSYEDIIIHGDGWYIRNGVTLHKGHRIVAIDPRRTATADECDLHLAIDPGTDVLLFNGVLAHLARANAIDRSYVASATSGFADALSAAMADAPSPAAVAAGCGLAEAEVERFFRLFAGTERTVTAYSQGVNQSSHGTDKVNAIINCHLATGRIGRPGMGPFSVTGQPNAMGVREVGGLANQLGAHMGFDAPADIERVARFWDAPKVARRPGLKAFDMFRAVGDGRIKALWIIGTNPAVSMPDATRVRAALRTCDFIVVSDVTRTDTTRHANVLLPAAAWGEKSGTVTNSERRLSRQRPFLPLPGSARPDWDIVCGVARRMGFGGAFAFDSPAAIFREHAALSAFENGGARLFDLGGLSAIADADYEHLPPRLLGTLRRPRLLAGPLGQRRSRPAADPAPALQRHATRPAVAVGT